MKLNNAQRQSLARYFYDMAKLSFGAVVLTRIWESGNPAVIALGLTLTISYTVIAIALEKEVSDDQ